MRAKKSITNMVCVAILSLFAPPVPDLSQTVNQPAHPPRSPDGITSLIDLQAFPGLPAAGDWLTSRLPVWHTHFTGK